MRRSLPLWVCLAFLAACGREPGGDPLRVVPADAASAAVAPSLRALQAQTVSFLAGIEGSSGLLDLLADRFGLDLRTAEGPLALGLDVDRAIAVFTHGPERAWVGAASVSDPERFVTAVRARLEKGAGATLAPNEPSEIPEGGAWHFVGSSWRAALGVTSDRIGILVIAPEAADVVGRWNAIASGRAEASFSASPQAAAAKQAIGVGAVIHLVVQDLLPEAPAALGLARGIVQNIRDSLPTFTGGIALPSGPDGDRLVVKLSAAHVQDGALPVQWVRPKGTPDALAKAFPKTTTAFLRLRFALDDVRSLPTFIRENVLPERVPGLEALPLPTLSDLIDLVDGDFAVGLLGLDAGANLGMLQGVLREPKRALSVFHVALAARALDANKARSAFSSIALQLSTSGWTVAPIVQEAPKSGSAYSGWSLARDGTHYAVLIDDQIVVFLIGPGEVESFLAVKEGRALSLAAFAEQGSDTVKLALGQGDPSTAANPFGLALSPLRLSRELSARGLPPYFLKIINDVRLLSATVGASEKRLDLSLEIAL